VKALSALFVAWIGLTSHALAEPVAVRFPEGLVHGFLSLSSTDGKVVASGDLTQRVEDGKVTNHLVFRFRDGSVSDELAVYTQQGYFRLLRSKLVQKGPTFKTPLEMTVDATSGRVTVHYKDDDGKEKTEDETLELPADLANGMIIVLLKNIRPAQVPESLSLVVATPKPRIVKLKPTAAETVTFTIAGSPREALHYVIKTDIGGVTGLMAKVLGKMPPDAHVWVLQGEAPAFVRSEAPLFRDGPLWRMDLVSPTWPS
jgi:hypothetical protein